MEKLWNVQMNMILSVILIIYLIHWYKNMNKKIATNKIFMWMMGLCCTNLILEIFDVILNTPDLKEFYLIHRLINLIGFVITPCIPLFGCVFIKEWINRFHKDKINISRILILPLAINGVAALGSLVGHGLFIVTQESIYMRGEFFWVGVLVNNFYFVYSLYFIYKNRDKTVKSEQILFSLLYIMIAFFSIIQVLFATYFTIWKSASVICIVIYIFILNDQAYRDALTGLGNRLYYDRYIQNFNYKKKHNIVAVYIDLDDFKMINDMYGHSEGDDAIRIFSNKLKDIVNLRNKKIIRVGGDEFLLIIREQSIATVEKYMERLHDEIILFFQNKEKPYQLNFSYGIAHYDNSYANIAEFLEHTDELMYGTKSGKKKS